MRLYLVALSLLLCILPFIYSWGSLGHRTVVEIGRRLLTQQANDYLHSQIVTRYRGPDGANFSSIVDMAPYPDVVRSLLPWSSSKHFVNVPQGQTSFDPARDCSTQNCVYFALQNYTSILSNTSITDPQLLGEALAFLVHFMGDVSQPLHCGYAQDLGGNTITLNLTSDWMVTQYSTNLHALWDALLLQHFQNLNSLTLESQVFNWYVANYVTAQRKQLYFSTTNWTPLSMVEDSFQLATQLAYNFTDYTSRSEFAVIYYEKMISVVHDQISKNGMRLGALLNQIAEIRLGGPSSTSVPLSSDVNPSFSILIHLVSSILLLCIFI